MRSERLEKSPKFFRSTLAIGFGSVILQPSPSGGTNLARVGSCPAYAGHFLFDDRQRAGFETCSLVVGLNLPHEFLPLPILTKGRYYLDPLQPRASAPAVCKDPV
jgi:hypothetical protein